MFIQLTKEETYKGHTHPKGACIEVGEHLGGQMLLNSIAVKSTKEAVEKYGESLKQNKPSKKDKKVLGVF